ncbi:hypothetical protein L1887_05429 [Cichorium endivia]|nr:hypothetical protein L1887_05429 [Cichorium endivia]
MFLGRVGLSLLCIVFKQFSYLPKICLFNVLCLVLCVFVVLAYLRQKPTYQGMTTWECEMRTAKCALQNAD